MPHFSTYKMESMTEAACLFFPTRNGLATPVLKC